MIKASVKKEPKHSKLFKSILTSRCPVFYSKIIVSEVLVFFINYHLWFLFEKVLFKDYNFKFVKIRKVLFQKRLFFENFENGLLEPDL